MTGESLFSVHKFAHRTGLGPRGRPLKQFRPSVLKRSRVRGNRHASRPASGLCPEQADLHEGRRE